MIWHFCTASDSRKIERIQERALRAVYRSKSESYDTLLQRLGLTSLRNRKLQDIAIYMYKIKNQLAPSSVAEIFRVKKGRYSLRNSDFDDMPRFQTVGFGNSLRYFGPVLLYKLWSKLYSDIKSSSSLAIFKNMITKHFISFEGVLDIFRRFWGVPNFMVEFWNTLHLPSTHAL